jgi:hypothetical protein
MQNEKPPLTNSCYFCSSSQTDHAKSLQLLCASDTFDFNDISEVEQEEMRQACGRTDAYSATRASVEDEFFRVISQQPSLAFLAERDDFGSERFFYAHVIGTKSERKKLILNKCLMFYVYCKFTKKDGTPYQPNSTNTRMKTLFAVFASHGMVFSRTRDFNYKGGWASFLKDRWNLRVAEDPTFGARPNKAVVPENHVEMAREGILRYGRLDLHNNVKDIQMVILWLFGLQFLFRGVLVSTLLEQPVAWRAFCRTSQSRLSE